MSKNNLKVKRYIEKTDKYITQGDKEFKDGDLRQAGEKYWGAATQILKAYCELKGWPHDGHALLFKDVSNLCVELGNRKMMEQFSLASTLHTNFYEGWLTKEQVDDHIEQTMEFINKIKQIIKNKEEKER
ncbi:MAG: PaREP1 family protein [bacterium]